MPRDSILRRKALILAKEGRDAEFLREIQGDWSNSHPVVHSANEAIRSDSPEALQILLDVKKMPENVLTILEQFLCGNPGNLLKLQTVFSRALTALESAESFNKHFSQNISKDRSEEIDQFDNTIYGMHAIYQLGKITQFDSITMLDENNPELTKVWLKCFPTGFTEELPLISKESILFRRALALGIERDDGELVTKSLEGRNILHEPVELIGQAVRSNKLNALRALLDVIAPKKPSIFGLNGYFADAVKAKNIPLLTTILTTAAADRLDRKKLESLRDCQKITFRAA